MPSKFQWFCKKGSFCNITLFWANIADQSSLQWQQLTSFDNSSWAKNCGKNCVEIVCFTDYGRPIKPFFIETFGLGLTIWADKYWGIWRIFGQFISTHFGTVSPLSMLSINQPLFLQKKTKPLYPNIYLGLGLGFEFELGPQRIILIVKPLWI